METCGESDFLENLLCKNSRGAINEGVSCERGVPRFHPMTLLRLKTLHCSARKIRHQSGYTPPENETIHIVAGHNWKPAFCLRGLEPSPHRTLWGCGVGGLRWCMLGCDGAPGAPSELPRPPTPFARGRPPFFFLGLN